MFSLFSLPITVSGVPVANGSIVLTLVGGPATIISTGGAAPSSYTFNLDANGNPPATMQVWGNQELSPAGTNYTYAVWSGANGTGSIQIGPFSSIVGPSAPYAGTLYPNLTVLPLLSFAAINGIVVTGTPSAGQFLKATSPTAASWSSLLPSPLQIGATDLSLTRVGAGTLGIGNAVTGDGSINVSAIKQGTATGSFAIFDNLGVSHFFIAGSSPYTNTFIRGNGAGVVFLGSAALCSVADTTGNLSTSGNITSSQTGGGSAAGITAKAAAPFVAFDATGQAADQKWWDLGVNGTQLLGRAVNDANNASATWLTVNRSTGATIGAITFGAGGGVQTLPTATDTLVGKATTDVFTNKTYDTAGSGNVFKINGTQITANTGSGSNVLATSPTITSVTVNTGVSQGSGFKHQRFGGICTTSASAGATCTTAVTWTNAFADANYSVVCTGHTQSNTAAGPTVENVTASGFTLRVSAITATAASFSTVDCIAAHD